MTNKTLGLKMREIILDTETTGLDPSQGHRIVEIGAVEMINKSLTGKKFHAYVNPKRNMPSEAYRIHGISSAFLQDKPLFSEVADAFLNFIQDSVLVIHNAPFDIKFLNHELSLSHKSKLDIVNTIDTLLMARRMFPGNKSSLDALCKMFKVDNSARQLHGALLDAYLLAEVYVELTGGRQSNLFESTIEEKIYSTSHKKNTRKYNIVTLKPTNFELKMHKEFLNKYLPSHS